MENTTQQIQRIEHTTSHPNHDKISQAPQARDDTTKSKIKSRPTYFEKIYEKQELRTMRLKWKLLKYLRKYQNDEKKLREKSIKLFAKHTGLDPENINNHHRGKLLESAKEYTDGLIRDIEAGEPYILSKEYPQKKRKRIRNTKITS
eukprot:721074-Pleurochrysis_carterae.AAC.1